MGSPKKKFTSKEMILSFVLFVSTTIGTTFGSCLHRNQTWLSPDILDTVQPVPDPYQCQVICGQTEGCEGFTWTSANHAQLRLFCFLFYDIFDKTECEECISGSANCICSDEVACRGDVGNTIDVLEAVLTEAECQNHCLDSFSCKFYTWYSTGSFPAHICVLLSSCEDTVPCNKCFSGTPECSHELTTTTPSPTQEGLLISGGDSSGTLVEVYNPVTDQSCVLPSLPCEMTAHTMDNLTICGGWKTQTTCISFTSGKWVASHTLGESRWHHNSWGTEEGMLLLGGEESPDTTENILQGQPGFPMKYSISNACSISDLTSSTLIITGGEYTMRTVSRYGPHGFLEDLPALVVGRQYHGCGSYYRQNGDKVLLVAGGWDGGDRLSSTEVLYSVSSVWAMTTPLPRKMSAMKGVTL